MGEWWGEFGCLLAEPAVQPNLYLAIESILLKFLNWNRMEVDIDIFESFLLFMVYFQYQLSSLHGDGLHIEILGCRPFQLTVDAISSVKRSCIMFTVAPFTAILPADATLRTY